MIRDVALVFTVSGWALGSLASGPEPPEPAAPSRMVIVKTVDVSATSFKFDPAEVVVQPGDTVRFQQTTSTPHNVEFTEAPSESKLGDAKSGPYLLTPGQTYDVVIDGRLVSGVYHFVCTPHQTMGMTGTLTVRVGGK